MEFQFLVLTHVIHCIAASKFIETIFIKPNVMKLMFGIIVLPRFGNFLVLDIFKSIDLSAVKSNFNGI
jgi:hypothetical protein